jgi:hypothetical protein
MFAKTSGRAASSTAYSCEGGRERGKERERGRERGEREGVRERERERGREMTRERGREGERERGTEGERERMKEGERERGREGEDINGERVVGVQHETRSYKCMRMHACRHVQPTTTSPPITPIHPSVNPPHKKETSYSDAVLATKPQPQHLLPSSTPPRPPSPPNSRLLPPRDTARSPASDIEGTAAQTREARARGEDINGPVSR